MRPALPCLGLALFIAALAGCQGPTQAIEGSSVFVPDRRIAATPADRGLAYEPVTLTTSDGVRLEAWFIPAEHARATVLFCHGNAGNISSLHETARVFHNLNLSVLLFDYRGYGRSEGKPSEEGTYRDAQATWSYLTTDRKLAPASIVVVGRSLGGGVASWLAQKHRPGALVLESTFMSVPALARQYTPVASVVPVGFHYDTLSRLPDIHCPVLIVHSPQDEVVPYAHGQQLFAATNEPKQFLQISGSHNDGFLNSGDTYTKGLDEFLSRHLAHEGNTGDQRPH